MNFKTIVSATAAANQKQNNTLAFTKDQREQLLGIAQSLGISQDQAKQDISRGETDKELHQQFMGMLDSVKDPNVRELLDLDAVA